MSVPPFIRPSAREIALGLAGDRSPASLGTASLPGTPRAVLEKILEDLLAGGPVCVTFSGGRDSSAVLAVARHVARVHGMDPPRPITLRYPGLPETDESDWQDLVIRHLGLEAEWIIVDCSKPSTYLGDAARDGLRRRGLVWPPALQLDAPELLIAEGATLLTGEGGDEVLGARRITPLSLLVHFRRRPSRQLLGWTAQELVPRRLNSAAQQRSLSLSPLAEVLTPVGRRELARLHTLADRRPLSWAGETRRMVEQRVPRVLAHNYQLVADEHDVRLGHPLQDARFLHALADAGGRWGYAGRTDAMRAIFADVLPDELLRRSTKASFGSARWGETERAFARSWDGSGIPTDLLDVEALRAHWLADYPQGATAAALHAAWLHSEGLSWEGELTT